MIVDAQCKNRSAVRDELMRSVAGLVLFEGVLSDQGMRVRWSDSMRQLFGLPAAMRGLPGGPLLNAWVFAADRAKLQQAVDALLHTGTPLKVHYHIQRPDGTQRYLYAQVQPLGGMQHMLRRVSGVIQDCTEQLAVTQTMQITQGRLHAVGRWALLGELASGLAHELNQPLTAIATFAQAGERLLQLPQRSYERAQQIFQEIGQQTLRVGDIVQHMRGLMKRHAPVFKRVACTQLVNEFLLLAEPMARAYGVQLHTQLQASDLSAEVDIAHIHQVLMILFQNALDAVHERPYGSGCITLSFVARAEGVEFSVLDNGHGITAAVAQQLYQPFFSTKTHGAGLGLVMCRSILAEHSSQLYFESNGMQGCRFWFVLACTVAVSTVIENKEYVALTE